MECRACLGLVRVHGPARLPQEIPNTAWDYGTDLAYLRSLKPVRTLQLDVVTEGQAALHLPVPTSVRKAAR